MTIQREVVDRGHRPESVGTYFCWQQGRNILLSLVQDPSITTVLVAGEISTSNPSLAPHVETTTTVAEEVTEDIAPQAVKIPDPACDAPVASPPSTEISFAVKVWQDALDAPPWLRVSTIALAGLLFGMTLLLLLS